MIGKRFTGPSCLLLGLLVFSSIPLIFLIQKRFYQTHEPYFSCPVEMQAPGVRLRNDSYGSGHFGANRNGGRTHQGLDFLALVGDPVLAAKSGRVTFAGVDKGYGNLIELCHPDGLCTRYAHLSALKVSRGQWVPRGTVIGNCGKTGNAENTQILPHLHFEIRNKQTALNPGTGLLDPDILLY